MHFTTATTPAKSQTKAPAMYSHISQFFSGTLDPTWPHVALIGGAIIGGALVGLEVILEAKKFFSVPTVIVFVGIVIEAACTVLLFGFDEGISHAQQSTIEQLLSPRRLVWTKRLVSPQPLSRIQACNSSLLQISMLNHGILLWRSPQRSRRTAGSGCRAL